MKPIEPGTRYGKRVVFGEEPILRKTHKIRGLWMRCDCGREDLVDRYQVTKGLASQCLDCQKVEQSLRMEAKWAKRKGELMGKVLIERELLECLADLGDEAIERMGRYLAEKHGEQKYVDAARAILAQPAEAEGPVQCPASHPAECYAAGTHVVHASLVQTIVRRVDQYHAALSAVTAEVEGLRKDAERYRWLIDSGNDTYSMFVEAEDKAALDAAIDASMAAKDRP